ncbi:hypothetical protein WICMUC_004252 [Wickerhamomyces mucosus]|uniref:DUF3533 domain-containing protein n=1 Tax=Wickerhamomyces mucosus TaxID=1378264 RepID=A0A9P8PI37_9ASCO|nr:hypothetical protein WICMUC_004252 [Wickerhamomyces mucosus]
MSNELGDDSKNKMVDPTEEEVKQIQSQGYIPNQQELAHDLYDMDEISQYYSRSESKKDHPTVDDEQHSTSSASNDIEKQNSDQPINEGPAPTRQLSIFHPSVRHLWKQICINFVKYQILIGFLIIASFSIYWGALYDRPGHLKGLKMLVVNEDYYSGGIGESVLSIIENDYQNYGTWHILHNSSEIENFFKIDSVSNYNISELILEQVHKRYYWSSTHIKPNATNIQLEFYNGTLSGNLTNAVEYIYETGRDITSVTPYVVRTLQDIEESFNAVYPTGLGKSLTNQLSDNVKIELVNSGNSVISPIFNYLDYRPYSNTVLLAPLQVGLIYLIIISFFLFNFFVETHTLLLPYVKPQYYLLYRIVFNHFSYLIVSMFICAVSAIFQVDFTLAFGRGGWVVYWLSTYLTLAAVGGANENMGMLIFSYDPKFLAFWLITFVILNVSPSFSPMALTNDFYRYGYMMPIHHSNEIYKVIFMDLWKGQLGLNYGILVVWIVLNTLALPFVLKHVGKRMAKKAQAAAQAAQATNSGPKGPGGPPK